MIVETYGNRPCLTDQVVADFPPDLQRWVYETCERPTDSNVCVWLLPIPSEEEDTRV